MLCRMPTFKKNGVMYVCNFDVGNILDVSSLSDICILNIFYFVACFFTRSGVFS